MDNREPIDLTVGGLWAGAGAGLLGASIAGFNPVFNLEPRTFVTDQVMKTNFPDIYFSRYPGDIQASSLEADLIVGSPDCKIFSNLGTKRRAKNLEATSNPFNNDFFNFIDSVCEYARPDFFIVENVPNILHHLNFQNEFKYKPGFYVEAIKSHGLGPFGKVNLRRHFRDYYVQGIILNSKDFKVPQSRKRFFLIGSKINHPLFNPDSLHRNTEITLERMRYGETVGEAFDDISRSKSKTYLGKPFHNNEPPKHSSERVAGFSKLMPGDSYYGTQNNRRLYYDRLSWTVASSCSRFVHPVEPRTLTVRETARLMGWPDRFIFQGTSTQQLDQVGKSIVPQIIFAIANYLRIEHLKK